MLRLAAEAALIVAVAVIAGVAQFRGWVIVLLMALAFLVVAVSEWLAARARFVPPAVAFLPPLDDSGEPAPYVEAPAPARGQQALEPAEDTEPDALTMIEPGADEADEPDDEAGEPDDEDAADEDAADEDAEAVDPWEQVDGAGEPEAELAERGGIFRRRRR